LTLVGGVAGLSVLWDAVSLMLSASRGLDLTDEGLYLLAADPPNSSAAWFFPWGWHTGPLFRLLGYDIANFRTAGAFLLVLAGAWLGWQAVDAARSIQEPTRPPSACGSSVTSRLFAVLGPLTGGAGALLFYASYLRTPGYNWLDLLGILIAAGGFMGMAARGSGVGFSRRTVLLAGIAGLGLVIAAPAKPSTPVFQLVLGAMTLSVLTGPRQATRLTALTALFAAGWIAVAVVAGLWPVDFIGVFVTAATSPALDPSQTVGGALANELGTPSVFLEQLRHLPRGALLLWASGSACLLASFLQRPLRSWLAGAGFLLVALGAGVAAELRLPFVGGSAPIQRIFFAPAVVAAAVLMIAALIARVATAAAPDESGTAADSPRHHRSLVRVAALVVYLGLLPFVFGFGSSNGMTAMASWAVGIFLVATVVPLVGVRPAPLAGGLTIVVAALSLALVAVTIRDARANPYRIAPLDSQTVSTPIGVHGASLELDPDLANLLTSFRTQATAAGFRPGTATIGLLWRWSSTVPYSIGARVPNSLMLTDFGWGGAHALLVYNLTPRLKGFPAGDAWILTSDPATVPATGRETKPDTLALVESATGRAFPSGYRCVANAAGIELWRPDRSSSSGTGGSCPAPLPVTSHYDLDSGWSP
jgi:hypothetical protein